MDESAGAASEVSAVGDRDRVGGRSPWRALAVCSLAVILIVVVGTLSWQRRYEGAPSLGDRGAATAHSSCGLVSVDHDGRMLYSEIGAPGAAELEASWGNQMVPGRLHLDDRQREDHREWTATGRFVADDGTEVAVSGMYGEKFMMISADCF